MDYSQRVEETLNQFLQYPENTSLCDVMRYAVLGGGKRIRANLVYTVGKVLDLPVDVLDHIAAAIEFFHAATLIHDDLPCIDNDNMRRGKPSTHIVYGEGNSLLAGDALFMLSSEVLNSIASLPPEIRINILGKFFTITGIKGVISGEFMDINLDCSSSKDEILKMYNLKTAVLIEACLVLPGLAKNLSQKEIDCLSCAGKNIGLAFQIQDDLLEITTDEKKLGKPTDSDKKNNKKTYLELVGMEESQRIINELYTQANYSLNQTKRNWEPLHTYLNKVKERDY